MDRSGAEPFSALMERALYDPELGFYERGGRAGRREGAFLTSPEVGPLFGAVLARMLDARWAALGRPDPFVVEDHGAGPGTLARSVLAAPPACGGALRLILVERSARQRQLHAPHLPHRGELTAATDLAAGHGPAVWSATEPPGGPAHLVVANELLDNLPFDLFERTTDGWVEICVEAAPGELARAVRRGAADADRAALERLAPEARVGARAPLQRRAGEWLAATLDRVLPGGAVVAVDYATVTTAELVARPDQGWLRTYADHDRGGDPLTRVGAQDITADVAIDQLAEAVGPPSWVAPQADALRAWGLEALVEEGRQRWEARSGPADLAALTARSRVGEAAALTDPDGLGAHRVMVWERPPTS